MFNAAKTVHVIAVKECEFFGSNKSENKEKLPVQHKHDNTD